VTERGPASNREFKREKVRVGGLCHTLGTDRFPLILIVEITLSFMNECIKGKMTICQQGFWTLPEAIDFGGFSDRIRQKEECQLSWLIGEQGHMMQDRQGVDAAMETDVTDAAQERRTQQQRREETRRKLIAAAIDLILEDGCANLTTARVAKEAGLTRGAIQYHFSSPKDLLREVVVTVVKQINALVDRADLAGLEKSERLDQLIDHYWEGYRSGNYIVFLEITIQGRRDADLKLAIKEAIDILEQERDEQWLGLFLDYPQPKAEKLNWRSTLLVLLRGLAVKQMFADPAEDMQAYYLRSKDLYKRYIEGGPPPL